MKRRKNLQIPNKFSLDTLHGKINQESDIKIFKFYIDEKQNFSNRAYNIGRI